jgi:hypothetical protein
VCSGPLVKGDNPGPALHIVHRIPGQDTIDLVHSTVRLLSTTSRPNERKPSPLAGFLSAAHGSAGSVFLSGTAALALGITDTVCCGTIPSICKEWSMANAESSKSMTFQVQDAEGQAYNVLLRVQEHAASGTLVLTPETGAPQQHLLTRMQKGRDGKTLQCYTGAATVTFTIEEDYTPPRLRLVARVFFPVLDTTYTLSKTEQEHLVAWLHALHLPELS